jgi:hypothetical protein
MAHVAPPLRWAQHPQSILRLQQMPPYYHWKTSMSSVSMKSLEKRVRRLSACSSSIAGRDGILWCVDGSGTINDERRVRRGRVWTCEWEGIVNGEEFMVQFLEHLVSPTTWTLCARLSMFPRGEFRCCDLWGVGQYGSGSRNPRACWIAGTYLAACWH